MSRMERIAFVAQLLSLVKDAETGERGYLVTHDTEYLVPYKDAVRRFPSLADSAVSAFRGDAEGLKLATQIRSDAKERLRLLDAVLRIANARGFEAAAAATREGTGRRTMERLRTTTAQLIATERAQQDRAIGRLGFWQLLFYSVSAVLVIITSAQMFFAIEKTKRQVAEEAAKGADQAAMLYEILAASTDSIFIKNAAGVYTHANKATLNVMGQTDAVGRSDSDIFPEGIWQKISADDKRAMETDGGYTFEEEVPAGLHRHPRHFLTTKTALRNSKGYLFGILGISKDITDRKRLEERQQLLINELNHRVKNSMAVLHSMVLQTFKNVDQDHLRAFEGRLAALSYAHDVLTNRQWVGASLRDMVKRNVAAHCGNDASLCTYGGPDIDLSPQSALAVAMILHERRKIWRALC